MFVSLLAEFLITLFAGYLGVHRFLKRQFVWGVVYLFTFGLFGIGWIVDTIKAGVALFRNCDSCHSRPSDQNAICKKANDINCELSAKAYTNPTAHNAYIFSLDYIAQCQERFIAFDLETTGLDATSDRIIEISAVLFENFAESKRFSTLINPGCPIPPSASRINGIYDEDVKDAPEEKEAIESFCSFVGKDALNGNIVMVAHNAMFDIKFLLRALSHSGIEADICFQDTLYLSRNIGLPVEDNKLGTLSKYFNIPQENAHRASDDARVCGEVFIRLLDQKRQSHQNKIDAMQPPERELCLWIKRILTEAGCNTQLLTFNASTYLSVNCFYTAFKFKPRAKRPYALISGKAEIPSSMETAPATKSEGDGFVRVFFQKPTDLEPLREFLVGRYTRVFNQANAYISESDRRMKEVAKNIDTQICV